MEHAQIELSPPSYEPALALLDSIWLALFRRIQHDAGLTLVRLRAWPAGHRAALSLRYDIDRDTSELQARSIVGLQASRLGAPAASWFGVAGSGQDEHLEDVLAQHQQERGVHALSGRDAVEHRGATCHSSPGSEYWRGRDTVTALERAGASYAEMLAAQYGVPRPGWVGEGPQGRRLSLWLLPVHFPLEGSTGDRSLAYFDRLLRRFRELLDLGGHAIIASHPDLDQSILAELLDREDLRDVWAAPIGRVVERCRRVLEYGAVSVLASDRDDELRLLSRHTLADVAVEIHRPGAAPRTARVHLREGIPRRLRLSAAPRTPSADR
jgi:hypothetical protein